MTQNFPKLTTMTEVRKNSTETTIFSNLSARKNVKTKKFPQQRIRQSGGSALKKSATRKSRFPPNQRFQFFTQTNFGVSADNNVLSAHTSAAMDKGRKVAPCRGRKSALSLEDQLLVTLMRLRLGRLEQELAYMFNVDAGTISRVFNKWIRLPLNAAWNDTHLARVG